MGAAGVASFAGEIPVHYDRGLGPVLFHDFGDQMAVRAAAHAPSDVLELAGGTGIVSRRLRDRLPAAARLTVTDLAAPMLDVARSKFAAEEAVTFQTADACALPFADGAFDLAVCQFGVMFFPDKAKGFAEAFRVLRPGGRYLFSAWDAQPHNPMSIVTQRAVDRLLPDDPPRFYDVPFSYHSLDQARNDIEAAGFTGFAAEVAHIDKSVPDLDAFARGIVFGNPLADQLRDRGADLTQVHAAIADGLRDAFGEPALLPTQAIFFQALRPRSG